jgi:hypothetical protein
LIKHKNTIGGHPLAKLMKPAEMTLSTNTNMTIETNDIAEKCNGTVLIDRMLASFSTYKASS